MHFTKTCIAVFFMVSAVQADGPTRSSGKQTGAVKSASDAQALYGPDRRGAGGALGGGQDSPGRDRRRRRISTGASAST